MNLFAAMTFLTPWALAGLVLLPAIWWLLRFTPPRPEAVTFPPIRLLLGLFSKEEQPEKTPWWLMAIRLALAGLVIIGVAHPLYQPGFRSGTGAAPMLLVVDDSWAAAVDWPVRRRLMEEILRAAGRASALTAVAATAPAAKPPGLELAPAGDTLARALALEPRAMAPDRMALLARLKTAFGKSEGLEIVWLSDGVDPGDAGPFAEGLAGLAQGRASLEVLAPAAAALPVAMSQPSIDGGRIKAVALRAPGEAADVRIEARARNGRSLADAKLAFAKDAGRAEAVIDLPLELRNEASRIEVAGNRTAGGVYLFDDRWRRKTVALHAGSSLEQSQPLLSPLYFVARALEPYAEIAVPGDLAGAGRELDRGLSMMVLADVGVVPPEAQSAIGQWLDKGGVLLRFAGARLAAGNDPLVPVAIREGERSLGSSLSWETPQALAPFPDSGPFAGLALDGTVHVTRQVLAEPDADLPDKVWASLADGTPLVTATRRGKGLLILVHVTANADWSNLPLSGLFVEMLRRILDLAPGAGGGAAPVGQTSGGVAFMPVRALSGFGELGDPPPEAGPVPPRDIDRAKPTPEHPAGLYTRGAQERAINVAPTGDRLTPIAGLPAGASLRGLEPAPALPLAPWLFVLAFLLFLADCIAAMALSGKVRRLSRIGAAAALALLLMPAIEPGARAQNADEWALRNALSTRLAYVTTGDPDTDAASAMGLDGLTQILIARTSVEPEAPAAVDIEKDELVFFPFLYWPVVSDAEAPSAKALARIGDFMKNGGTILFDLRDDGLGGDTLAGGTGARTLALRRILEKLDVPPLETVPPDHVLTKSFYLLDAFPGRYEGGPLWVETAGSQGSGAGNGDGVSPIVIGSNDYASAWAMDANGNPVFSTIPGGERQRELSYRVGVNIVMYALTGNYKADQVHVPALLERLGQ